MKLDEWIEDAHEIECGYGWYGESSGSMNHKCKCEAKKSAINRAELLEELADSLIRSPLSGLKGHAIVLDKRELEILAALAFPIQAD